jgi:hypothetical protein
MSQTRNHHEAGSKQSQSILCAIKDQFRNSALVRPLYLYISAFLLPAQLFGIEFIIRLFDMCSQVSHPTISNYFTGQVQA